MHIYRRNNLWQIVAKQTFQQTASATILNDNVLEYIILSFLFGDDSSKSI